MLTDKTLSTDDYDNTTDAPVDIMEIVQRQISREPNQKNNVPGREVTEGFNHPFMAFGEPHQIMREPMHKTKRRARRASARLQFDKDMLKYAADSEAYWALPEAQRQKAKSPVKPKDWRAPKAPMPVANLWFSRVKQKGGIITAKLGKLQATLPVIPEVKILLNARDGTLIQVPVAILSRQFGGRAWR